MERKEFIALALLVLLLASLAFAGDLPENWRETEISQKVRIPRNIQIIPPADGLPKEIAAWSGRREGVWDFGLLHIFIVEETGLKTMKVMYAWGSSHGRSSDYVRKSANVLEDGKKLEIYFSGRYPLTVIYEMGEDGIVRGTAAQRDKTSYIVMEKIE